MTKSSGGSRGVSGGTLDPLPPPPPLNIPWKWNNLVSVRPNYFIFMGYLRKMIKFSKANPLPSLYIWTPFPEFLDSPLRSGQIIRTLIHGRVVVECLDSRPKGSGFEPHQRHCVVSLSKNINPCLVLVQLRKSRLFITERFLMGHKESNQTKKEHWSWSGSKPFDTPMFLCLKRLIWGGGEQQITTKAWKNTQHAKIGLGSKRL